MMKITKRQLKRVIREEIEQLDYDLSKDTTDMMLDKEHPEDVEAQEDAWAGGQNIHHQLDHSEAGGGDPQNRGVEVLRISESGLREAIRHVIVESAAEQLLNLPKNPSPMDVYQSVIEWMGMYQDPSKEPDAGLVDRVIANVMVKHQVSKDDPVVGQKLNMLRKALDPNLGRRQSYRRGIEDEMRELDPTGDKQRYGQMFRSGGRAVKRDW